MPTPTEVHNQYLFNLDRYYTLLDQLNAAPDWQKKEFEKKVKDRKALMEGFSKQWSMMTGRSPFVLLPPGLDSGEDDIDREERRKSQERPKKIKEGIQAVRSDLSRLQGACEGQVEARLKSFYVSQFADLFVTAGPMVPVNVSKKSTEVVEGALKEADKFLRAGRLDEAEQELERAATNVNRGFDLFNEWVSNREAGAGKPEAAIRTAHSVTTSFACSLAPGRFGNMMCSGVAEFSLQASLLSLNALSGKQSVSWDDLEAAGKEVAIAAGSAQLGNELGPLLSKGLARHLAARILGREPSEQAVEFVAKRISAYVAIWSSEISKKMVGLKKDDFNGWLMLVAPAIDPMAVELMKEQESRDWLTKAPATPPVHDPAGSPSGKRY